METLEGQIEIFTCGLPMAMEPKARAQEACMWVRRHKPVWSHLKMIVHAYASTPECMTLRRGDVYILAQQRGMSISDCRELRFDNNLWSMLSRLLIMTDPSAARVLHPKRCALDMLDLRAIYIEECGDDGIGSMSDLFAACPWLAGRK